METYNQHNIEKYDYDLTSFKTAEDFKNLLKRHGLTEKIEVRPWNNSEKKTFAWYNPETNLVLTTSRNPLTGFNGDPEEKQMYQEIGKEPEKGSCSYVAIEGEREAVKALVKDFEQSAQHIKDGGKEAGFSSVRDDVKEKIPYYKSERITRYNAHKPEVA